MSHFRNSVLTGLLLSSLVGLTSNIAQAETVFQGSVCSTRVNDLTSQINWYTDLKKAEKDAQGQNKLVFWMNMLGKIDGATWSAGNSLRAVSLSTDPTFSLLKSDFICGYKDISRKHWAGASGKHRPDENAVDTTNGAGPHNIQMFVMTPDGVVLHCLPGYWHSQDLASELRFAEKINQVWLNPNMTRQEKNVAFSQMQLQQVSAEPKGMSNRSHMQGFDLKEEAKKRPHGGFFYNAALVDQSTGKTPPKNVKTVDIVMHERMAQRPFLAYKDFDVPQFSEYGKTEYDKHEQFRMANGQIEPGADLKSEPMIGNDPRAHPIETQVKRQGKSVVKQGLMTFLRYGTRL